ETNPIERVWWSLHETLTRNHRCPTLDHLLRDVYEWVEARKCFHGTELLNYANAALTRSLYVEGLFRTAWRIVRMRLHMFLARHNDAVEHVMGLIPYRLPICP